MLPLLGMLHKFERWKYEHEWRLICEKPTMMADHPQDATPSRIFLGSRLDDNTMASLVPIVASNPTCSLHTRIEIP